MAELIVVPFLNNIEFSKISDHKLENVYYISFPRNKKSVFVIVDSI